jgi:hypothetical protein
MRQVPFTKSHLILITSITLFCSLPLVAQQTNNPPPPQVHAIRVIEYAGDLRSFLSHMPRSYNVSIGLEVDPTEPQSYVTASLQSPTIDDVLAAVVKSKPRYAWRRNDGFVDVYPIKGSTPLLDTTVNSFRVYQVTQAQAIALLFDQPEVKSAMTNMNLICAAPSSHSKAIGDKFSIDAAGLSVRQLLHQITMASGAGTWVFIRRSGPHQMSCTIEMVEK